MKNPSVVKVSEKGYFDYLFTLCNQELFYFISPMKKFRLVQ